MTITISIFDERSAPNIGAPWRFGGEHTIVVNKVVTKYNISHERDKIQP